ncbi:TetR/AcrR family transcriptional regulator [Agromyces aerolatus]|uniref:TetR/AcrR family transcriptional regulator n=1 Tax=Agromyces sp. LY-1074 TaxID=3074080 RepID=UPI00285584AF|nr:TetR/AcrR family transcriptional regulator [Agromyces sp. LY-1358]MDR5706971.1 TetR/AcrR family transcriptional regulator [Agromyces sp. LY-1358]
MAERLGVHHTLLTYHFGSRPGLLHAVLVEARRRDNLVIAAAADGLGFVALGRLIWDFYSSAEHEDRIRAFFHVVGLVVYERDAFEEFVADIDDLAALLEAAALRDGAGATDARQQSILVTACLRGLLLQKLLTPAAQVDVVAERFLESLAPTRSG